MLGVGACVWPSACGLCMCGWVAVGGGRGACVQFISDVQLISVCVCVCVCVHHRHTVQYRLSFSISGLPESLIPMAYHTFTHCLFQALVCHSS